MLIISRTQLIIPQEFTGMACSSSQEFTCRPFNKYRHTRNFYHHKHRVCMLSKMTLSIKQKVTLNHLLFKETRCHNLYKTITNEIYKLTNYDQITILRLLNALKETRI